MCLAEQRRWGRDGLDGTVQGCLSGAVRRNKVGALF